MFFSVVSAFVLFDEIPKATLQQWKPVADAPATATVQLQIGLKQQNLDSLVEHLYQVSDPEHPSYGKHWSRDQVLKLTQPSQKSVDAVQAWLKSHGVQGSQLSFGKDILNLNVRVEQLQKMLNAKYQVFEHTSGAQALRAQQVSLPKEILDHVEVIHPTTFLGSIKERPVVEQNLVPDLSCNNTITPQCLKDLYNMDYTPVSKRNKIGVTGYLEQYANFQDLQNFLGIYKPEAVNATFDVQLINNGTNDQDIEKSGGEAALDIQYVVGLTWPTKAIFYSTGGSPPFKPDASTTENTNEPYLEWTAHLLAQADDEIPYTVTTSYGDNEQTVPRRYAQRVCFDFAKLGLRGISLLFSSGDGGVAGGQTSECISNDGKNTTKFLPTFPASCPFVTSVGGTRNIPEKAVGFSSGGFSEYFPTPLYQLSSTLPYVFKLGSTYNGLYNRLGRGIPDVAAQGRKFQVSVGLGIGGIGGTSASCPAFASVISNLNDALLAKNRPPLGFLNPWLYSRGYKGLNDITSGNNPGCDTPGFNATKNWDPVTGLGTPDFGKLRALLRV
ncbi:subtilisin-like protein [Gorgonomyces haynaldii]|nr:subtilisin-like protein [Gorgonomyces haynaldii]